MMSESQALIAELDSTLQRASSSQQVVMLRRVTDLFINGADAFGDEHVALFNDVIGRLIDKADRQALAELSNRLALIGNAPANVVDRLARHEDIAVAGPLLQKSNVVSNQTLIEVAGSKAEKASRRDRQSPGAERVRDRRPSQSLHGGHRPQGDREQRREPLRTGLRQADQPGQD